MLESRQDAQVVDSCWSTEIECRVISAQPPTCISTVPGTQASSEPVATGIVGVGRRHIIESDDVKSGMLVVQMGGATLLEQTVAEQVVEAEAVAPHCRNMDDDAGKYGCCLDTR